MAEAPPSTADHGAQRYAGARRVIDLLERFGAAPSPLNYELWMLYAADPGGAFALEANRLAGEGAAFTEAVSEELALQFLPRHKLSHEIHETGEALARQLESVGVAVDAAQGKALTYGRALSAGASEFERLSDPVQLRTLAQRLTEATREVERETAGLADLLARSTQDVRRMREHMEQVRRDSLTDMLTALPNRKAFDLALRKACKAGEPLAVALLDIDHFKTFNDTWGHQTGDQVIRYVASVLARAGHAPRMAARYGGEEFAILLPGDGEAQAAPVLDELRRQIGSRVLKRRSTNEDLGSVTISVGVAARGPGEPEDDLVGRADAALYASKRGGRNRLTCASALTGEALMPERGDLAIA